VRSRTLQCSEGIQFHWGYHNNKYVDDLREWTFVWNWSPNLQSYVPCFGVVEPPLSYLPVTRYAKTGVVAGVGPSVCSDGAKSQLVSFVDLNRRIAEIWKKKPPWFGLRRTRRHQCSFFRRAGVTECAGVIAVTARWKMPQWGFSLHSLVYRKLSTKATLTTFHPTLLRKRRLAKWCVTSGSVCWLYVLAEFATGSPEWDGRGSVKTTSTLQIIVCRMCSHVICVKPNEKSAFLTLTLDMLFSSFPLYLTA